MAEELKSIDTEKLKAYWNYNKKLTAIVMIIWCMRFVCVLA